MRFDVALAAESGLLTFSYYCPPSKSEPIALLIIGLFLFCGPVYYCCNTTTTATATATATATTTATATATATTTATAIATATATATTSVYQVLVCARRTSIKYK